ncbi:hypothetical protein QA596_06000 [Balneolales bacterium ANBcel1]|nr:hypothetical protein [Balneolales bacterium ANBcel1]
MDDDIRSKLTSLIDAYVRGKLKPEETDFLWTELLRHPEYYDILRTRVALQKKMLTSRKGRYNPQTTRKPAIIIGIAAALLVGLLFSWYQFSSSSQPTPLLEEIRIVHMISPEVTRSAGDMPQHAEAYLQNAFIQSASGNTEEAIEKYISLQEQTMFQDTVSYNLGILYYNSGDFEQSATAFANSNCTSFPSSILQEKCFWFRTNAYLAINDYENALVSARETVNYHGVHEQEASTIVRRLSRSR